MPKDLEFSMMVPFFSTVRNVDDGCSSVEKRQRRLRLLWIELDDGYSYCGEKLVTVLWREVDDGIVDRDR
nr:hypothetical protein Itr_chr01CG04590 [Ipomoea trifida]